MTFIDLECCILGWPSWIYDDDLLDAYYKRFDIAAETNYYKMYDNMVKHFSWTFLSQLEKSVNRHDFGVRFIS